MLWAFLPAHLPALAGRLSPKEHVAQPSSRPLVPGLSLPWQGPDNLEMVLYVHLYDGYELRP